MTDLTDIDYFGYWWLPEEESRKIPGTIFIKKNKYILQTLENFGSHRANPITQKHTCIIGVASAMDDGKDHSFKLFTLHQSKRQIGALTKNYFTAGLVLIGDVHASYGDNNFVYLMLTSRYLSYWVKKTGIEINGPGTIAKQFEATYKYNQPSEISLFKNEDLQVSIFFRVNILTSSENERKVTITETPFLNIKFSKEQPIHEILEQKILFERFFTIIWQLPITFNECEVRTLGGNDFRVFGLRKGAPSPIWETLPFENFVDHSQKLLHNWLNVSKELELLVNTFFTSFHGSDAIVEDKFLSYCFSLELYHRIRIKSKEPVSKNNKEMYDTIMNELKNENTKNWIGKFLNKERDVRFSVRLKEMFLKFGGVKYSNTSQDFIRRIVKTRNFYVHLDDSLQAEILNLPEVMDANKILSDLMITALNFELIKT